MTNQAPQLLYMLAEDLYRIGSATSSTLEKLRGKEVDLYERNGIEMVSANGKGISLVRGGSPATGQAS